MSLNFEPLNQLNICSASTCLSHLSKESLATPTIEDVFEDVKKQQDLDKWEKVEREEGRTLDHDKCIKILKKKQTINSGSSDIAKSEHCSPWPRQPKTWTRFTCTCVYVSIQYFSVFLNLSHITCHTSQSQSHRERERAPEYVWSTFLVHKIFI